MLLSRRISEITSVYVRPRPYPSPYSARTPFFLLKSTAFQVVPARYNAHNSASEALENLVRTGVRESWAHGTAFFLFTSIMCRSALPALSSAMTRSPKRSSVTEKDPCSRRRRRYPRTHTLQGHVLPDMRGFILEKEFSFEELMWYKEFMECSVQTTLMLVLASLLTSIRKYLVDLVTYLTCLS